MPWPALSKAESRRLKALRQRSGREEAGVFLAEGIRVVEELIRSPVVLRGAVVSPSIQDTQRGRDLALALDLRTNLLQATEGELRELADTDSPQGVVVSAVTPRAALPSEAPPLTLVLDAVQDPGNFGTLVRSAAAFGAGLIVALPGCVDPWNAKVIRSAAGTSFHVPVVQCDVSQLAEWSAAHDVRIWGAAMHGEHIDTGAVPDHVALVLGNEGGGIRQSTAAVLHRTVSLRMRGNAESLNAAVAGGILLYLLSEKRA